MVLILLVPLGAALADEETFTASIPDTDTDFTLPLSLPQFDPSQGVLLSAEVILTGGVSGTMQIENTSTQSAGNGTIQLSADVTVALASDPGTPLTNAALPEDTQTFALAVYDGVTDFAGPSGATIDAAASDTTTGTITDAATLADLTGTGTIDFLVDAVGTSFATADTGNVVSAFFTQANADLTIIYQFDQGEIQIVKTPDLQTVESGADAEFTIEVTNTGPVDLVNVEVTDPLAPDCDNVIGDLAVGESTTYTCTATNVTAPFTNVATVDGEDINGNPVTDDDDAEVVLDDGPVSVTIEKSTNGADADTPTGPEIAVGDTVTWEYVVTNDGEEDLTDVVVVDDQGVTVTCPEDTLDVGESLTCTATGVAVAGQYANVGTVTGSGIDSGTAVTASDPSHYFGTTDPAAPAIQIVKNPNSQVLSKGDTATFTITVTNPGPVDLVNVVVTDPMAPDCDATIGPLAVDESSTYTCTVADVQAGFTNVATTTGEDDEGTQVTDSDDAVVTIGLPETGAPFGELAGFGLALLLGGFALMGFRRRYQS